MVIPNFRPMQFVFGVSPRLTGPPNTICICQIFVGKSSHQKFRTKHFFSETIFDDVDGKSSTSWAWKHTFLCHDSKKQFLKSKITFLRLFVRRVSRVSGWDAVSRKEDDKYQPKSRGVRRKRDDAYYFVLCHVSKKQFLKSNITFLGETQGRR